MTDSSATLASEIATLEKEIKALDKAVKEATEEEKLLVASGAGDMVATAAPEMIPGTSIAALQTPVYAQLHQKGDAAPPAPPATWDAYQKKDGKSNGVIALMEMLIKELE